MITRLALVSPLLIACGIAQGDNSMGIVPLPKHITTHERTMALAPGEGTQIVLGDSATESEKYAAERLQGLIARRFEVTVAVCAESACPDDAPSVILLGQPSTNQRLKALCERRGITIAADPPGLDAYAIEVLDEDGVLLVCGSNDRSVIYGAQTLFKLLTAKDGQLVAPVVTIRDWASIPWRGRPYTRVEAHLEPGVMDAYLWAGLNFIDVRAGAFGYGPDAKLDHEQIGQCISEAHRRALFVFGTVSCGIKPEKFDGALRIFRELIDLGVDGLWISFDDPGGGTGTTELVERVIELGKEKGFEGREIATTPPSGSYQYIETEFNRDIVKVAGMENATWFFTRNPCREDLEAARRLGLKSFPAWWHNWPRTDAGFTHGSYGGVSFRPDKKPSYIEVPPLTWGWHRPNYDKLRDAPTNTDTVMMWGGWQPEYTCAVLGIWAWNPEQHEFDNTRRAIYETVYGASSVEPMMRLDDALHELKAHFILPERSADPTKSFPARLRPDAKREDVQTLLAEMEQLAKGIGERAPAESLLAEDRLETLFLEPLRAELAAGKALATLERPEDWWPAHEADAFARLRANDKAGVEELSAEVRPKLEKQLAAMQEALFGLVAMDGYLRFWRERAAGGVPYFKKELQRRAQALRKRIADRKQADLDVDAMLASISNPPQDGTLLASVTPQQFAASPITYEGKWLTGLYPAEDPQAFVMSFPGRTPSTPGDFCQVTFQLPCPAFEGKLHLQLHLTDEYDSDRWTGYRFYQLLHKGEVIWEEDIALTRRGGREWTSIDISKLAAGHGQLEFTLRLLDKRAVGNYTTTIFIGPVRLVDVR